MCEAEFPNVETLDKHIDLLHGKYRFYSTWLGGVYSHSPYVISPTEKRGCKVHSAAEQQQAETVAEDEPYVEITDNGIGMDHDELVEAIQNLTFISYFPSICDRSRIFTRSWEGGFADFF